VQKRIERARALAAAHQLTAAASELETIRASVKDSVVHNVVAVMLMGIYLEDGNYARSGALLEETFKERTAGNEASVRTFYALAGQAINGTRAHLARYRTFAIDVSSSSLPVEATTDLDRLRSLIERMVAQAKELVQANAKDNDAFALLEDVAGIRASLARDNDDRVRWDTEYSAARAKLATLPMQVAATTSVPVADNHVVRNAAPPATEPAEPATASVAVTDSTRVVGSSGLFEVGSLFDKATKKIVPTYPQTARNAAAAGLVRVKIAVDESGSVANVLWVEGPMLLRQTSLDAVRQWKFTPLMVDGKAVRMAGYIDFSFAR
jgi:TonB family protein